MTVYLVGAGPGDPGLLTRRGAEVLCRADVVVYDRLVDPVLLALAPSRAEMIDAGKTPGAGRGEGAARQAEINRVLVERGLAGATVVRLKGGDPFLFGRGGEEAEALRAADVEFEVVPGVPSAFAVPASAGIPVTHRGMSTSVTVVTGHVEDPGAGGGVDWASLGRAGGTLVVLMGMAQRAEIARRLLDAGRPADTPVAVVEWGTTPAQRVARTTLEGLARVTLGSPAVIVVGDVAGFDLSGSITAPLSGTTVVVTRPRGDAPDDLADALRAAGARVVPFPVVEIAAPSDGGAALVAAASDLARYEWIAFTSANAVRCLLALVPDVRVLSGVRLAAVGPATAAALVEHRLVPDLVPDRTSAAGLGGLFPVATAPGAAVLFPCSESARPTLPAALREKGWVVDVVVAYRTVPAPAPPVAVVRQLAHASAVTFASPSAVEGYVSCRTDDGSPLPVPPVVACIGPVTADAARAAGLAVTAVASSASAASLVGSLIDALAEPSATGPAPRRLPAGALPAEALPARRPPVRPR
ncbi:MAG TPA: uroporphyrinogen-III C-methyltransferase [Acidimicrobiales bacterium]|nr:uroporphyrinogen-III C-methyltransferase [Acidimicrobiales bacterium]